MYFERCCHLYVLHSRSVKIFIKTFRSTSVCISRYEYIHPNTNARQKVSSYFQTFEHKCICGHMHSHVVFFQAFEHKRIHGHGHNWPHMVAYGRIRSSIRLSSMIAFVVPYDHA